MVCADALVLPPLPIVLVAVHDLTGFLFTRRIDSPLIVTILPRYPKFCFPHRNLLRTGEATTFGAAAAAARTMAEMAVSARRIRRKDEEAFGPLASLSLSIEAKV
ncbi:MAG: hypothetical protein RL274_2875 [Pseudomonadota bacterium]|jgi:hypothetical protein